MFEIGPDLLGTKVKPRASTSSCGEVNVLEERFVMYLLLLHFFCTSFFVLLLSFFLPLRLK